MPSSYEGWLSQAEEAIDRLTRDGVVVHKVEIDIEEFLSWAKHKGLPINGHLRSEFATEKFAKIWAHPDLLPSQYPDQKRLKEIARALRGVDSSEVWEPFLRRPKAAICPIFVDSSVGPEQIGSGVLVSVGDAFFLLTAAHVTDWRKKHSLLVPSKDGFFNLFGLFLETNLPESGRRLDDRIDMGCLRLDQQVVENLHPQFLFLDARDADMADVTHAKDAYTLVGFPVRKSGKDGVHVYSEQFSLSGEGVEDSRFERLGLDPHRHILIQHRFKRSVSVSTGLRTQPPHPEGMSGGGIFAWSKELPKISALAQPKLVAIITEYHEHHNVFVGTRISVHLSAIQRSDQTLPILPQ